ncbi:MAG: exo-alpha-sialidase [Candidatus Hydrogenedentes bacterium]|nr:exo-alpha-sialidase [Candidatus Hydrogenedentota bacterium]
MRQCNGREKPFQLPAQLQIVTESWNRVTAVPYIVYMPEKNRLLMLMSCDYPHHPMILTSDDRGATWTEPKPVALDKDGKVIPGLGTALTYLSGGRLILAADRFYFSSDYGVTWGGPDAQTEPFAVPPAPDGKTWNLWDPKFVETTATKTQRLIHTGYTVDTAKGPGPGFSTAYLRYSADGGRTWKDTVAPPQWKDVNEVTLVRAKNGDLVAACRTDIPAHFKGETIDHLEGLGASISKDDGHTWSELNRIYDWGRHHPSMVVAPNGDIVMTYVVRKGYVDTADGMVQFGIEAIVSHDNGANWDLDHRYILHTWPGNHKGPDAWTASSQATSTVLFTDGTILTAFGTGYRIQSAPTGGAPRDVGLVQWRLNDVVTNSDRTLRDAPFDSDKRNLVILSEEPRDGAVYDKKHGCVGPLSCPFCQRSRSFIINDLQSLFLRSEAKNLPPT